MRLSRSCENAFLTGRSLLELISRIKAGDHGLRCVKPLVFALLRPFQRRGPEVHEAAQHPSEPIQDHSDCMEARWMRCDTAAVELSPNMTAGSPGQNNRVSGRYVL